MSARAKKTTLKSTKKPTILVYCGPTIPHICARFSMFSVVPDALNQKAETVPLIRNLILPISELRVARQQIEECHGPIYSVYMEVKKSI